MALGEEIVDREGKPHQMAGLLPVKTSFEDPKLHLGYRSIKDSSGGKFSGHEFHFASTIKNESETSLFQAEDSEGTDLGNYGCSKGSVSGSFLHLIASNKK